MTKREPEVGGNIKQARTARMKSVREITFLKKTYGHAGGFI